MGIKLDKNFFTKFFFLTIGPFIAAIALEGFLVPNNMIDGGIIGISMMFSYVTKFNLGLAILLLNLPFILLAFHKLGKFFVLRMAYATLILGMSVNLFHNHHATQDLLLATVYGGIILGFGVGLVLRNSAAMDGTEILAISISKKFGFSVGEIIMFFNVFIYTAAGFLYGPQQAMYSILTYFITYKVIDIVIDGFSEAKSVNIVSNNAKEIGDSLIKNMDIGVTYINAKGGYSGVEKELIFCVVSRLELTSLKSIVKSIDPKAFISVENVHEVEGTRIKDHQLFDTKAISKLIKKSRKKSKKSKILDNSKK